PPFALPALGQLDPIALGDSRGQVVVLNFWASWCRPCREEAPTLERLARQYRSRGVRFLGVDSRDTKGDALAFQRRYGITYPSVFDPDGNLEQAYRVVGLPTTFLIGPGRRMRYQLLGKVRTSGFRESIGALMRQVP